MAYEIPVHCDYLPYKEFFSRFPVVAQNASPLTLFFHSLYYFGKEQYTVHLSTRTVRNLHLHREITPFLKSKGTYILWTFLKVLVHVCLVWNWRIWLSINALGLFFEYQKFRLKLSYPAISQLGIPDLPIKSDPGNSPAILKEYLKCAKIPKVQKDFFKSLTAEQQRDFCYAYAQKKPTEVTALLKYDLLNDIFEDKLYVLFLKALLQYNTDVFLCCHIFKENANALQKNEELQETLLKSLSVSSLSEKSPTTLPFPAHCCITNPQLFPQGPLTLIIAYLPQNDRARIARCCKLLYALVRDLTKIPPIQRSIGEKLLWYVGQEGPPIDTLSKGQIDLLFKIARQRGILSVVLNRLKTPKKDTEIWKYASELYLSMIPERPPYLQLSEDSIYDFVYNYEIYSEWKQGKIPEQHKSKLFGIFHLFYLESSHDGQRPLEQLLAQWILEQGSQKDKELVCVTYLSTLSVDYHNNGFNKAVQEFFLRLMERYLDQSKEAFETYFFTPFQHHMEQQATQLDEKLAQQKWREIDTSLPFPEFLEERLIRHNFGSGRTRLKTVLDKLHAQQLATTAHLLCKCLASFYSPFI